MHRVFRERNNSEGFKGVYGRRYSNTGPKGENGVNSIQQRYGQRNGPTPTRDRDLGGDNVSSTYVVRNGTHRQGLTSGTEDLHRNLSSSVYFLNSGSLPLRTSSSVSLGLVVRTCILGPVEGPRIEIE